VFAVTESDRGILLNPSDLKAGGIQVLCINFGTLIELAKKKKIKTFQWDI
jgi:hypothetical protein